MRDIFTVLAVLSALIGLVVMATANVPYIAMGFLFVSFSCGGTAGYLWEKEMVRLGRYL